MDVVTWVGLTDSVTEVTRRRALYLKLIFPFTHAESRTHILFLLFVTLEYYCSYFIECGASISLLSHVVRQIIAFWLSSPLFNSNTHFFYLYYQYSAQNTDTRRNIYLQYNHLSINDRVKTVVKGRGCQSTFYLFYST